MSRNEREEGMEHGKKVDENRPQEALRHAGLQGHSSMDDIRRAGGSDPRRHDAKIMIERVVTNHDMSGYNHNSTPSQPANNGRENEMWAKQQDVKAVRMGTPNPDGTYSR